MMFWPTLLMILILKRMAIPEKAATASVSMLTATIPLMSLLGM